jgi:hypothetical protein
MVRKPLPRGWLWGLVGALAVAGPAGAQQRPATPQRGFTDSAPALASISPPTATLGKSVEWAVTGRNLAKVDRWIVSGQGVEVVKSISKSDTAMTVVVQASAQAEPGFRELRAMGPHGLSNLAYIRVDRLDSVVESEPNDEAEKADEVAAGAAVVGVLRPQDLDHFRFAGKGGRRVTIEVEAQRLGTPIVPVVTLMTPSGAPLAQATETRGTGHDCRLTYTFPADGPYVVQVRDSMYGGGESAIYRLRLGEEPYATGLFPLGGPRGQSIVVTASGGNLTAPLSKTITLPDSPGAIVEVGAFDSPGGPVLAPGRVIVGDGPEVAEGADPASPTRLALGTVANGRVDRPGEVDRYVIPVKKGDRVGIRVRAEALGSWLDSVVTLRDDKGDVLAEKDDLVESNVQQGQIFNNAQPSLLPDAADSRLEYEAKADGELTVEVADRYGDGGPEYAYRLEVGPARPDFAISLLLDPNVNNRQPIVNAARRPRANTPGISGSLNLRPGSTTNINFLVTAEGKTGTITVRGEGLPPGVTVKPVRIQQFGAAGRNAMNRAPQPSGGAIALQVAADAAPALGELRIVGEATLEGGTTLTRTAVATLAMETNTTTTTARPVTRTLTSLPVRILGELKPPVVELVGPPPPARLILKDVKVPGVLFQGDRIDLALQFDPPHPSAGSYKVEAMVPGRGLSVQAMPPTAAQADAPGAVVRVTATADVAPGTRELTITVTPSGGDPIVRNVPLAIRPPITIRPRPESIALAPGGTAKLWVGVEREPGFKGEVELRINPPRGVRAVGPIPRIKPGQDGCEVTLAMADAPGTPAGPAEVRITGVVRLRTSVRVESAIRPMIMSPAAEK